MKKPIIAALVGLAALSLSTAHADITSPISSSLASLKTSNEFNMDQYEEFRDSSGFEVYIYASRTADNRFLVLDSSWSPLAYFTSSMTEEKARTAGLEFATTFGLTVELTEAAMYYYNGAYGYGFDVTEVEATEAD